ncbi:putative dual-specificity RNA methyltransferase RlmN [Rubritalea halochordaticola]|uniref:Probable dual-specificity RNA methyltransferase RlmN n=1 Tax=Rubritalea halochordaticola TaxID=714537 RepID=A0ABP9V9Y4_9BACT
MSLKQQPLPGILGLTQDDLNELFAEFGEKPYRAKQVIEWIYKHRTMEFDEMLNLPAALRDTLKERFRLRTVEHVRTQGSEDTTRKFLFKLHDGRYVETVLIPASPALYGEKSDRHTVCVSSQVGCAYGCKFCASGLDGFTRNLTADEIVGQLMAIEELADRRINNIVFMGMGEPLANFKNLNQALDVITGQWGMNIGARHITISTSGLAPMIKKLADRPQQIRLAISLHGATDETRDKIMPVNSKWKLAELTEALQYYKQRSKKRITFEYILIKGINDNLDEAHILAKRAKALGCLVNLIPYNKVDGLDWERPAEEHCYKFRDIVRSHGVVTTLRIEKGHDIDAACGQLRLKQETAEGIIKSV